MCGHVISVWKPTFFRQLQDRLGGLLGVSIVNKVRWGILGCARIAREAFISSFVDVSNGEVLAIASRDSEVAHEFANEYAIPRAYGSYQSLIEDPDIDAIYIPLPNALHAKWAVLAAEAHKAVLCEKPLAIDQDSARRIIEACKRHGVLLAEGLMYRHHPQIERVQMLVASGAIGPVRLVRATITYDGFQDPTDIRYSRTLGGGSLMDLGCYGVNFIRLVLRGEPVSAKSLATFAPGGVEIFLPGYSNFLTVAWALLIAVFDFHGRHAEKSLEKSDAYASITS